MKESEMERGKESRERTKKLLLVTEMNEIELGKSIRERRGHPRKQGAELLVGLQEASVELLRMKLGVEWQVMGWNRMKWNGLEWNQGANLPLAYSSFCHIDLLIAMD